MLGGATADLTDSGGSVDVSVTDEVWVAASRSVGNAALNKVPQSSATTVNAAIKVALSRELIRIPLSLGTRSVEFRWFCWFPNSMLNNSRFRLTFPYDVKIACITAAQKPSNASRSIHLTTATMSRSGSTQITFEPLPFAK